MRDNKPIKVPEKGGEELASAVARALRGGKGDAARQNFVEGPSISEVPGEKKRSALEEALGEGLDEELDDSENSSGSNSDNQSVPDSIEQIRTEGSQTLQFIDREKIRESSFQTRVSFKEKELEELADSIRQKGILQPLVVRELEGEDGFELIAGERRLRAAGLAGVPEVPALVHSYSDQEALECSIIENAQREDLNSIEEARAYNLLSSKFGLNQAAIAEVVGKNRATVANSLRLLQLDEAVIELLEDGSLSAGHGRALLQLDQEEQLYYAQKTLKAALSVRALEKLVQRDRADDEEYEDISDEEQEKIDSALRRLETKISNLTDIEDVSVTIDGQGRKRLGFVFETDAALKRFVARLR